MWLSAKTKRKEVIWVKQNCLGLCSTSYHLFLNFHDQSMFCEALKPFNQTNNIFYIDIYSSVIDYTENIQEIKAINIKNKAPLLRSVWLTWSMHAVYHYSFFTRFHNTSTSSFKSFFMSMYLQVTKSTNVSNMPCFNLLGRFLYRFNIKRHRCVPREEQDRCEWG